MSDFSIDVLGSGAVLLGLDVTSDGFHKDHPIRVQTHVHSDHMKDFTTSKGGEIVMTQATARLLDCEHSDLETRGNVHRLKPGQVYESNGNRIELLSSGHMLGAAQVKVELKDGTAVGYSGDFSWPLDEVIQVDALVVDATYGNPTSDRKYTQEDAIAQFVELVKDKLRSGPVHIMAYTGPAELALHSLTINDAIDNLPVVGSNKFCKAAKVHTEFKLQLPDIIGENSETAKEVMKDGTFIRYWGLQGNSPMDGFYDGTVIRLTKYRANEPIVEQADNVFVVGISNHADYDGTMEYIKASGAEFVITDNLRGEKNNRGVELARAIRTEFGIKARVSSNTESRMWGG